MRWNKYDRIEIEGRVRYECIVCDEELAVFAKTFTDPEDEISIVTDFEEVLVFDNNEETGKNGTISPIAMTKSMEE